MYTTILSDFSRVIIKPKDKKYLGALNPIHRDLTKKLAENYNIFDYFELNHKLLDFFATLKPRLSVSLFTTDIIQNHPQLKPFLDSVFKNIFAASDYNINKKEPAAYSFMAEKLGARPEDILYIDDRMENIEAAKKAGMETVLYVDNDDKIIGQMTQLLSK